MAKEEEIGDIDVEVGRKELDLLPPLPNSDGAEAVNQKQGGLPGVRPPCRGPEVDGGLSIWVDLDGPGGEA